MKILGLGDCCVDYYIHKKTAFPGGNAFNIAIFTGDNGADAAFLGTVGDDAIGAHILKCAAEKGVDTSHCPIKHGVSGRAAVNIVEGDRVFVSNYFDEAHGVGTLFPPMLSENDLKYVEQFDLVHSACYAHVENQLLRLNTGKLLVTFDFSEEDKYRTDAYLANICPIVDLALFSCSGKNEEEYIAFAKKVQSYGCKNVLMTMGKGGQMVVTEEGLVCRGQAKMITAVDTMGAGDSFFSAFIVNLLRLGWKKNEPLTRDQIEAAFEVAAEYSSRICMVEGSFGMGMEIEF